MKKVLFLFSILFVIQSNAQVAINTSNASPDASSMLDISSTSSGLLIPRMTASDRDNISSPATGLTVYVTDDNSFYYYNGTSWIKLQESGKSWLLQGNAGTNGSQFLGTTDSQPLIFKTNGTERVKIDASDGAIGIHTAPNTSYLMNVEGDNFDTVGNFVSTRTGIDDYGIYGKVANTDYYGIGGGFEGGWMGIQATVFPNGNNFYYGVDSYVNGGTGTNYGVDSYVHGDGTNYGINSYVSGDGTNYGVNSSISGNGTNSGANYYVSGDGTNYGVSVETSGSGTNYSIFAITDVASGSGATEYAFNNNANGIGLISIGNGLSSYTYPGNGAGIVANGDKLAVVGFTELDDDNAIAVLGQYTGTTNTDATGVYGYSKPADNYGYGVKGVGGWIGVYGRGVNGFSGIYGYSDNSSYAIYGVGDLYVTGDIMAGGNKPFYIDHPLDPANKILRHFALESNEVLNVYRGNVILDNSGKAIVNLPSYFNTININFSYNLTPIGKQANLYIEKEIDNNGKFVIAGGNPGQKISWYVFAERNDPYLQQNPEKRRVEFEKEDKFKGKYFKPELYGQPKEKGIGYKFSKQNNIIKTTRKKIDKKLKHKQKKDPKKLK